MLNGIEKQNEPSTESRHSSKNSVQYTGVIPA
jgi:hypothetical protein